MADSAGNIPPSIAHCNRQQHARAEDSGVNGEF